MGKEPQSNEKDVNQVDVRKTKFWKFWVIMFALTLGLLVVIGRLLFIQIVNSDEYLELAAKQQQTKQEIISQRGNIYDRNGNLLASTIKSISIAVDPTELQNKDALAALIEKNIGISQKSILEKINSSKGQFLRLCRRISPDKVDEIRALKDRGILLIDEPTRYYNYSSVGSQVIGCTNLENQGLSGIEMKLNSLLSGKSGYMIMYRDAKQRLRPALNLPMIEPENGADIYLTLDIELQKIVEFELMQGVLSSQATSGTIIALDPGTGEVLACASYPNYNPNLPATYSSEGMKIRAIVESYEPGSTFKAITAAAGIEEKLVRPTDAFNGFNGVLEVSGVSIRDEHPLGITSFKQAFEHSSNIVMSQLALKIPDNKFYKYIRDFGFGLKTDIDLPGEISGRTPKFDLLAQMDKRFVGFGYGVMVTPIQLVSAYSAIANQGKLLKPYVISKVVKEGKIYKEYKPQFIRQAISEETAKILTDLLVGAVQNGTGTKAYIKDLQVAGKTGTTQMLVSGVYSKSNHLAFFVGFYPAAQPKICMLVCIEQPRGFYGGSVSAPIFKNIALRWASISSKFLDEIHLVKNPNEDKTKKLVYVPELIGLSLDDAEVILNELNLKSSNENSTGIIISQFPKAGSRVPQKTSIILKVSRPNEMNEISSTLPNVKGLSLRRAISILHNAGFRARVIGNGTVSEQRWEINNQEYVCVLICK